MADAPYMYWVGMNTADDASPEEMAAFNDYYSNTHAHEVVLNNPGFMRATRYELYDQDARGEFGPRWLVMYEMDSDAAAKGYAARNDGPPAGRPQYTPGPPAWSRTDTRWRLIWRRFVPETGEIGANGAPYLMLIGIDAPPDTDEAGLKEFNDFYTGVHISEVVAAMKFHCASRYELYREFKHPEPGSPRFLAVYEGDEASLKARANRQANPGSVKISSGPPTWEAHTTPWRLIYKRIDSWVRP
jgi:hypothetical protein